MKLVYSDLIFQKMPKLIIEKGSEFDDEAIKKLPDQIRKRQIELLRKTIETGEFSNELIEHYKIVESRQCLTIYGASLGRWIIVSIFATSYISAFILERGYFELIMRIATKEKGSMSKRISSISFLTEDEKKDIKALWENLCSWAHPHMKWVKEICPIFESYIPQYHYHKLLFEKCIDSLERLVDFFLIISLKKYEIRPKDFKRYVNTECLSELNLSLFRKYFTL